MPTARSTTLCREGPCLAPAEKGTRAGETKDVKRLVTKQPKEKNTFKNQESTMYIPICFFQSSQPSTDASRTLNALTPWPARTENVLTLATTGTPALAWPYATCRDTSLGAGAHRE